MLHLRFILTHFLRKTAGICRPLNCFRAALLATIMAGFVSYAAAWPWSSPSCSSPEIVKLARQAFFNTIGQEIPGMEYVNIRTIGEKLCEADMMTGNMQYGTYKYLYQVSDDGKTTTVRGQVER